MSFVSRSLEALRKLFKYFVTTLVGTGTDCLMLWVFSSYVFADNHLGQYVWSPMVSFECGVVVNSILAYFYIWKERIPRKSLGSFLSCFWKFNMSCIGAFFVKMLILNAIGAASGWHPVVCNLIALCFSGLLNFAVNEFLVFKPKSINNQ